MIRVDRATVEPTGVGASEVGAVLGCDPWTTPLQLYRRKKGLDTPRPDSTAMALGRALEGPVVELARQAIPLRIRRNRQTFGHPATSLFATPDAFVGRERLLEVKVVGLRAQDAWDDDLPCRVRLQVQAQLFVTGREAGYVAQLVGTELRLTVVEADPDVQVEILNAVDRFVDLLHTDTPPDPLTWDERWADLVARLQPLPERDVLAGGSVQEAGARILAIRQLSKQLEDEERQLRLELLGELADEQGTRIVGTGWTGRLQETAGRTDWHAVADELFGLLEPVHGDRLVAIARDVTARHRSPSSSSFVVRGAKL